MALTLGTLPTFQQYQSDAATKQKLDSVFSSVGLPTNLGYGYQYDNAISQLSGSVDNANATEVLSGGANVGGNLNAKLITAAMQAGLVNGSITPDKNYFSTPDSLQRFGSTLPSWINTPQPFTPNKGQAQYANGNNLMPGSTVPPAVPGTVPPAASSSNGTSMVPTVKTSSYTGPSIVDYLTSTGQDSSFGARTKLAQQYGIQNYTGTAAQNTQLLNTLRSGGSKVPTGYSVGDQNVNSGSSNSITSESLTPASKTDVPGASSGSGVVAANSSNADTAAAQAQAAIKARQDLLAQTQTDTEKQDASLSSQLQTLIGQEAGKSAFTTAETQALVDPLQSQLTAINNQISALAAQKATLNADIQGKPITMDSIIGAKAQASAVLDAQTLTLTAQANALMNNISLAQTQVQQAVDAKYGPIEESISIAQAQRAAIADQLTKDEANQKAALDALDAQNLQALDAAKQAETAQNNVILGMISKYPDAGITFNDSLATAQSKLKNSKIYAQATRLSGGNGDGSFDLKTAVPEMETALSKQIGGQGYVSKEDWAVLLSQWVAKGGTRDDFVKNFSKYANPGVGYDYQGIEPVKK